MALIAVFDFAQINTYTQPELSRFVTDLSLDALVAGRRTKQNLIDVLTMHYNTIAPLAVAPPAIAPPAIAPPVTSLPVVGVSTGISAPSGITLNSI